MGLISPIRPIPSPTMDNNRQKKKGFWQRARYKYRLTVIDESSLNEKWHIRLSGLGVFSMLFLLFVIVVGVFSLLIIYTPIRNVLPGYGESIRQQLITESARVDSLSTDLELQRRYLEVIKQVTAGEIQSDTVQSLDSMQIVMRAELLEAKKQATEEFLSQYEEKEKDYLQFFDTPNTLPTISFFRPVQGVVAAHYAPEQKQYGIVLLTTDDKNVTSVLSGTVIYVQQEQDDTYTMLVQHENYLSVYRRIGTVLKQVGAQVQSGETLGIVGEQRLLGFELWKNGQCINPEEVIAF